MLQKGDPYVCVFGVAGVRIYDFTSANLRDAKMERALRHERRLGVLLPGSLLEWEDTCINEGSLDGFLCLFLCQLFVVIPMVATVGEDV